SWRAARSRRNDAASVYKRPVKPTTPEPRRAPVPVRGERPWARRRRMAPGQRRGGACWLRDCYLRLPSTMAAAWKGTISFGLVSIPVELHPALRDTRPHFHFLHAKDRSPVSYERVCRRERKPVAWEDL